MKRMGKQVTLSLGETHSVAGFQLVFCGKLKVSDCAVFALNVGGSQNWHPFHIYVEPGQTIRGRIKLVSYTGQSAMLEEI